MSNVFKYMHAHCLMAAYTKDYSDNKYPFYYIRETFESNAVPMPGANFLIYSESPQLVDLMGAAEYDFSELLDTYVVLDDVSDLEHAYLISYIDEIRKEGAKEQRHLDISSSFEEFPNGDAVVIFSLKNNNTNIFLPVVVIGFEIIVKREYLSSVDEFVRYLRSYNFSAEIKHPELYNTVFSYVTMMGGEVSIRAAKGLPIRYVFRTSGTALTLELSNGYLLDRFSDLKGLGADSMFITQVLIDSITADRCVSTNVANLQSLYGRVIGLLESKGCLIESDNSYYDSFEYNGNPSLLIFTVMEVPNVVLVQLYYGNKKDFIILSGNKEDFVITVNRYLAVIAILDDYVKKNDQ